MPTNLLRHFYPPIVEAAYPYIELSVIKTNHIYRERYLSMAILWQLLYRLTGNNSGCNDDDMKEYIV